MPKTLRGTQENWDRVIIPRAEVVEGTRMWSDDGEVDMYLVENNAETRAYVKRKKSSKERTAVEKDFPQLRGFLPGDLVYVTLRPGDICAEAYHNRHGVVTYGPDNEGGWQVAVSGGGDRSGLRCVAEELTLITGRDERSHENDISWQKEEKWVKFHESHKRVY